MKTADVVIVGAGVSGLNIALHLKRLGVSRVTVLERQHVGAGQSGRAAGIVRALVNNTKVASILVHSLRFFEAFNDTYGECVPVNRTGFLLLDEARNSETMDQAIRSATAAGCEAKRVSAEEANELQPAIRRSDEEIYAFEPAGLHLDPMLTTQALAKVVRGLGVEVVEGCEVGSIKNDGARVSGVETSAGTFLADNMVIATSVLGAAQLGKLGVTVPVYPHRVEMAFFSVFPKSPHRLRRIVSDARMQLYMRPEGTEQMFVGWREGDRISGINDFAAVDPENYRQTSNYESLADMQKRLTKTLPFMADGFVHRTYACVYDYTPDGMPILDKAEALSGLYFALGFSGGGFSLSPWVGSAMAQFIVDGSKAPEMQMLRLQRFQEGELVSWSNSRRQGDDSE